MLNGSVCVPHVRLSNFMNESPQAIEVTVKEQRTEVETEAQIATAMGTETTTEIGIVETARRRSREVSLSLMVRQAGERAVRVDPKQSCPYEIGKK